MNATLDQTLSTVKIKTTFDMPEEYKLKVIKFPNNTVDFIMHKIKYSVESMRGPKDTKSRLGANGGETFDHVGLTAEEREAKDIENRLRSARRAKQMVQHSIRSAGCDHMLTLITRENIQDRVRFFTIFSKFVELVRTKNFNQHITGEKFLTTSKIRKDWAYVAVPELQKRGAFHMHIACVGRQDISLLRACWYVALGGSPNDKGVDTLGQVDIVFKTKRWSKNEVEEHSTYKLSGYLTKYITKSFEQDSKLGINRYSKSRSIPKPTVYHELVWSCHARGCDFSDALIEVYALASMHGVTDFHPWNRGEDIFILRGSLPNE